MSSTDPLDQVLGQWQSCVGTVSSLPFGDAVAAAADHVLIMEMLKRGYAVARMPPEQLAEELSK